MLEKRCGTKYPLKNLLIYTSTIKSEMWPYTDWAHQKGIQSSLCCFIVGTSMKYLLWRMITR